MHIDGRLSVYSAILEESSEEPDDIMHSIGLVFASFVLSTNASSPQARSEIWFQLQGNWNNTVIKVGTDAFNNRLKMLYTFFDSSKLA